MRIVLLVMALFVFCSARIKTEGRSAKREMQQLKSVKTTRYDEIDMEEPWPFTETLDKTDPTLVELIVQEKVPDIKS